MENDAPTAQLRRSRKQKQEERENEFESRIRFTVPSISKRHLEYSALRTYPFELKCF